MVDLVEKYESREINLCKRDVVLSKYKVVEYTEGEVQMFEWNGPWLFVKAIRKQRQY